MMVKLPSTVLVTAPLGVGGRDGTHQLVRHPVSSMLTAAYMYVKMMYALTMLGKTHGGVPVHVHVHVH